MAVVKKNLRVCEISYLGVVYDLIVGVDTLDNMDDIIQEWAFAEWGVVLDLPQALLSCKDITEVLTTRDVDNFVYLTSTVPVYIDIPRSAGVSGTFPVFPATLEDGLLVAPECTARLFSLPNFLGHFGEYTIPEKGLAITEGLNVIGIRYNSGVPEYIKYDDDLSLDYSSIIPVATILSFSGIRYIIPWGQMSDGLPEKIISQNVESNITDIFLIDSTTNYVELSALEVRKGTNDISCLAVDTSLPNNDMYLYSHDGSLVWSKAAVTTLNNTQYQGVSGLESLTGGKYVVNYIYRLLDETAKMLFVILSGEFDTLSDAKESEPVQFIPDIVKQTAVLVGRAIILKDSTTPLIQKVQKISFGTV